MNYIVTNGFSELNNNELINVEGGRIVGIRRPFIWIDPPIRITLPVVRPVIR